MTTDARLASAHQAFARGDHAAVLGLLLPAAESYRDNEAGLALIANAALLIERPDIAVPMLERLNLVRGDHPPYRRILSQANNRLGLQLRRDRRDADAADAFDRAIAAWPDNFDALFNLALLHIDAGSFDLALPQLERLHVRCPQDRDVAIDYAACLNSAGRTADAQRVLEAIGPAKTDAAPRRLRHAEVLADADRPRLSAQAIGGSDFDAIQCRRLFELGSRLAQAGDTDAATVAYRSVASALNAGGRSPGLRACIAARLVLPAVYPDSADVDRHRQRYANALTALHADLGADRIAQAEPRLEQLAWSNFYLAYQGRDDRDLQAAYGHLLNRLAPAMAPEITPADHRPNSARRRIGLVGSIFRYCTAGSYFASWARILTELGHEVHVYQLGPVFDHVTEQIQANAFRLHKVDVGLNALAGVLRAAQLDLLIYPEVGMEARVLPLTALRLAPRQACAWGHPVTTGLPTIDAFFSCAMMEPENGRSHYSEPLMLLPGLGTDYTRPSMPNSVERVALGLPADGHLYLIPHALYKLHPDNDAVMAAIASSDPASTLVMFEGEAKGARAPCRRRIEKAMREMGADPDRQLRFLPMTSRDRFLQIAQACDVMVDSLHWSGGNTTLDALLCGVPVVTCPGSFMRGRQSAAMVRRMGLDELVVDSPASLASVAVAIAMDAQRRHSLRRRIEQGLPALFDTCDLVDAMRGHIEHLIDG